MQVSDTESPYHVNHTPSSMLGNVTVVLPLLSEVPSPEAAMLTDAHFVSHLGLLVATTESGTYENLINQVNNDANNTNCVFWFHMHHDQVWGSTVVQSGIADPLMNHQFL